METFLKILINVVCFIIAYLVTTYIIFVICKKRINDVPDDIDAPKPNDFGFREKMIETYKLGKTINPTIEDIEKEFIELYKIRDELLQTIVLVLDNEEEKEWYDGLLTMYEDLINYLEHLCQIKISDDDIYIYKRELKEYLSKYDEFKANYAPISKI